MRRLSTSTSSAFPSSPIEGGSSAVPSSTAQPARHSSTSTDLLIWIISITISPCAQVPNVHVIELGPEAVDETHAVARALLHGHPDRCSVGDGEREVLARVVRIDVGRPQAGPTVGDREGVALLFELVERGHARIDRHA